MENIKFRDSLKYIENITGLFFIILGSFMVPKVLSTNELLSELIPCLLFLVPGIALLTHFNKISYDIYTDKVIITNFMFFIKKQKTYKKSSFESVRVYLHYDLNDRSMKTGPRYAIELNGITNIILGKTRSETTAIDYGKHISNLMNLPFSVIQ